MGVSKHRQHSNRKRRGVALIWVALTFLVVFAILGLMLDWARVYITGHQLQNAADSAALAGARYVSVLNDPSAEGYEDARLVAQNYAKANLAAKVPVNVLRNNDNSDEGPGDDIVIGRYINPNDTYPDGSFIPDDQFPDAMKVVARKDGNSNVRLALMFGPLFGVTERDNIQEYAIAQIYDPYGPGLLALGECCECAGILFGGGGAEDDLVIFGGGSLFINSCYNPGGNSGALDQTGNSKVVTDVDRIYAVGGIDENFDFPSDALIQDYSDGIVPEPDPYEDRPDAVYDPSIVAEQNISASGTYFPGYYPGGMQVDGADSAITLMPGDYYLDSVGEASSMKVNGGRVTGEGVTLHIVGDANIGIDIQGNANIDISAPTTGPYADIAIFQKRNPNYDCALSCSEYPVSEFNGTGIISIDGAVYMPHNKLDLGGTGDIILTRAVADRFHIFGNSKKEVDYKGEPKVAKKSYLVE